MSRNAGRILVSTKLIEQALAFPGEHRITAAHFNPDYLTVEFTVEGPSLPTVAEMEEPPRVTAICTVTEGEPKPERIITMVFKAET